MKFKTRPGYTAIVIDSFPESLEFANGDKEMKTKDCLESTFLGLDHMFDENCLIFVVRGHWILNFLENYINVLKDFSNVPVFDIYHIRLYEDEDEDDKEIEKIYSIIKFESVRIINAEDLYDSIKSRISKNPWLDISISNILCQYNSRRYITGVNSAVTFHDVFKLFCLEKPNAARIL